MNRISFQCQRVLKQFFGLLSGAKLLKEFGRILIFSGKASLFIICKLFLIIQNVQKNALENELRIHGAELKTYVMQLIQFASFFL